MTAPGGTIRWGVAGTGRVVANFLGDLRLLPDAVVAAVSSRDESRARVFASVHNIPRAHGGIAALAADPAVEVVYVGGVNTSHAADARICLEHGKAVLLEKPFTVNAAEAHALANLARERGVFLMDAMWTRFFPAMEQAREWIQGGEVGFVRSIRVDIGHRVDYTPDSRIFSRDLGGGALLDLGIYAASLVSWCWDAKPDRVESTARFNAAGTDSACAFLLSWRDGRQATVLCALDQHLAREAVLYGEKGRIILHEPFWRPSKATLVQDHMREPEVFDRPHAGRGYQFEAAHVMDCLRAGFHESAIMPVSESCEIISLMDRLRAPWPMRYPGE